MQHSETKQFKILHVVSQLPVGGVENMLLKVVSSYDKKRFKASVCCIRAGGEIADKLRKQGYEVRILNRMQGHGFDLGAVIALYRLIKKEKVHILRTHEYHANLYGRLAGIIAGVPVIIPSFHNVYISSKMPKLHRRLFNKILSFFTDKLVAVSEAVASDIKKFDYINTDKVQVIYNGIVPDAFTADLSKDEMKKKFGLPASELLIGNIGRLSQAKGQKYLIDAVATLKSSTNTNISVAIAGGGHLLYELQTHARRLGVNAYFLGALHPEEIPFFLKAIDVFCFPSLWEGFGVVLVEAMASGLPVAASAIAPIKEVLRDIGVYFPPGDAAELAKALASLIENPDLRTELGQEGRVRAKEFYIGNTVSKYTALFDEILKKKGLL